MGIIGMMKNLLGQLEEPVLVDGFVRRMRSGSVHAWARISSVQERRSGRLAADA
jgi:hypothetical protein